MLPADIPEDQTAQRRLGCFMTCLLLFGILISAAVTVLLPLENIEAIYYGWSTQGWSSTTGTIRTSGAEGVSRRGRAAHLHVEYQYSVQGQLYRSERLRFGRGIGFSDLKSGNDYTHAHYPAGPVQVYYRTKNPGIAVLEQGLHAGVVWWLEALVTPIFGLALCAGAITMLRRGTW